MMGGTVNRSIKQIDWTIKNRKAKGKRKERDAIDKTN